jgi:hypothetical protein
VAGACWTRTDKGRHLLLSVDFHTDAYSPPPQVGAGLAGSAGLRLGRGRQSG